MSAPTHPGAPARPAPDPDTRTGQDRPEGGGSGPARRKLAVGAIVALVALGGGLAVQHVVSADAAATAAERRAASSDLARDVEAVRSAIADPARDGQTAATALLRHQLLLVAGEAPDPAVGDGLVEQLRLAGDELAEAAGTPLPQRPSVLPVATVDPVFERLVGLEDRAADLAERFTVAADEAATWLTAVRELDEAAFAYGASTQQLPSTDDPDAVAAAWSAERDRLGAYAAAIADAREHDGSAPLADAHAELVDGMRGVADEAVALLGAGDLDGYNALLADRLGGEDPFGFSAALETARAEVADAAIEGSLEETRARAFGLLTELDELRRATPAQLAELR